MERRAVLGFALASVIAVVAWLALRAERVEQAPASDASPRVAPAPAPIELAESATGAAATRDVVARSGSLPAPAIVVRILDSDRRPIADARVRTPTTMPPGDFTSGDDGAVRVPSTSVVGSSLVIAASATGRVPVHEGWVAAPEIAIVLADAVRLRGRVLEKGSRRPIAAARVVHVQPRCRPCDPIAATTDADGRYELHPVAAGEDRGFFVGTERIADQTFTFDVDGVAERDFVLDPGVAFSGEIVDFTTGAPIANAVVESEGRELARTDSTGRFEARAAAVGSTGSIDLRFGADGCCWLRRVWIPDELVAQSPLRVPLPRGAGVDGRVRDGDGRPVAGLDVFVRVDARTSADAGALAELLRTWRIEDEELGGVHRTDAAGRFATRGLVPHTPLVDVWTNPGEAGRFESRVGPLGAPGERTRVDFVLRREPYGTIAGRLLQDGKPVRGRVTWHGPNRLGSTMTDADGRFVLEHVETGRIRLATRRDAYRDNRVLNREDFVDLAAGQRFERDFDLTFATKPASGRVVRADGGSACGAVVLFLESPARRDGYRASCVVDGDGRFAVELPDDASAYRASVHFGDEGATGERDGVRAGDADVVIVVGVRGRVLCRAIDAATREPIARFELYARGDGDARYAPALGPATTADSDGWRPLELRAGAHDLVASASDLGYASVERAGVVVAPQGDTRIELELARGATVDLRLASGVPRWHANARVLLLEESVAAWVAALDPVPEQLAAANAGHPGVDPARSRDVDLARDDRVRIRGLAPGRYRLLDARRELALEPEWIDVRRDDVSVALRWSRR